MIPSGQERQQRDVRVEEIIVSGWCRLNPRQHPGRAGLRWDACATEALVNAAGGRCTDADGQPIDYSSEELVNTRGLVATNGRFHGSVIEALAMHHA